jgi:autotransporter-associated beta strand protein
LAAVAGVLLGGAGSVQADIAFVSSATNATWLNTSGVNTVNNALTFAAGSNGMLVVTIAGEMAVAAPTVTYNGTPLNLAEQRTATGLGGFAGIYYLADPAGTLASGGSLVISVPGNTQFTRFAESISYYTGVGALDTHTGAGPVNTTSLNSGSITAQTGSLIIAAAGSGAQGPFTGSGIINGVGGSGTSTQIHNFPGGSGASASVSARQIAGSTGSYSAQWTVGADNQAVAIASFLAAITGPTWDLATGGSWNVGGNWTGGAVPTGTTATAAFGGGKPTAASEVTLDAAITLNSLSIGNTNAITISQGSGGSLTFDGTAPTLSVSTGTGHVITAPVVLNASTAATVASGKQLAITGGISGAYDLSLAAASAGTLVLGGTNTHGNTNVLGGTLSLQAGAISQNTINVSGGALVQTAANAITSTAALNVTGGTATLSQSNNYNGGTTVSGTGKLLITDASGSAAGSGSVAINAGGALGGSGTLNAATVSGGAISPHIAAAGFNTLTVNTLIVNDTSTYNFNLGASGTNDQLIAGALTLSGTQTLNVAFPTGLKSGTYSLIGYTGSFTPPTALNVAGTPAVSYSLVPPQTGTNLTNYYVLTTEILTATWTGLTSGAWNTTTANWTGPGGTTYIQGQPVVFDDTGINTTAVSVLATGVNPYSVTFNNTNTPGTGKNYTLSNASGTIGIAGSTAVTVAGSGTVTFNSANTYTGGTTLANGILTFVNNGIGSSGNVTFNGAGGTLQYASGNTQDISARLLNSTAPMKIEVVAAGGTVTYASAIGASNTGGLIKLGAGKLVLTNTSNNFDGQIVIKEGTLQFKTNAGSLGTPSAGNETILLGNTSGTANATLAQDWDTTAVLNRGITVQAGSTGYAMIGGYNGRTNSLTINGALTLNKDVIINTSSEQGSGVVTLGPTATISGDGGIIKTSFNGTGVAFGNNYAIFYYQNSADPTHAFTRINAGLVRWERAAATDVGGDAVRFGVGDITLAANLLDNTGKFAATEFELYATQSNAFDAPVTLTNNIVVSAGGGSLYGWQDNNGGKPNITFGGTIDLGGTLGVGSRSSGSSSAALRYTGVVTINQAALGTRALAGASNTVAARMEGNIADGPGNYSNPLMLSTNAGTLTIAGLDNTYAGGTVILPGTGLVAVDAFSRLGTGGVTILPGGKLQVNSTDNIAAGKAINLLGSPAANGVLSLPGNYMPAIAAGATGIVSIDTTNLDVLADNGTVFLSSSLGAGWGRTYMPSGSFPATVTIGSGGVFTGTTLNAGPNGYQLGGIMGNLNIANGVLTGNNDLLVKGVNQVFNRAQTAINAYGKWSNSVSQVTLQSANTFTGDITVKYGILAGTALDSGSPFGNAANVVTLNGGGTLQVNGTATVSSFTGPAVSVDGLGLISAVRGPAATFALTIPSITRVGNSVVQFTGSRDDWTLQYLGNTGTPPYTEKIFVTTGMPDTTLTNNMLPAYYSFAGTDFANYDTTNGVTMAAYTLNGTNVLLSATSTDIVKNTAAVVLTAPVSVYALKVTGQNTYTGAPNSITIGSGGVIAEATRFQVPVIFGDKAYVNVTNADNQQLSFEKTVTAANGLVKFGPGSVQLGYQGTDIDLSYTGPNRDPNFTTLTGTITVLAGQLSLNVPNAFGGMMIDDSAFGAWENLIVLNGGMISSGGNHGVAYKHNFEIGAAGGTFNLGSGWESLLIGNVSGTGQVVFTSGGQANTDRDWHVRGTNNSYSGGTIIANSGNYHGVTVAADSSLGTGDVYVQTNGGLRLNGNFNIGSTNGTSIARQARVTVDGTVKFRSATPTIGSLAGGDGRVILGSDGTTEIASQPPAPAGPTVLTVGGDNTSTTFYGVISQVSATNNGSLTKVGSGALTLAGVNTYTGPTTVNGGALLINGSTTAASAVTVSNSGSTLGGSGTINGAVALGAATFIAPGSAANTVGTLTLNGGLTFNASSTYTVDLGAGADNADKLAIAGAPTLLGNISFNTLSVPDQALYVLLTSSNPYSGTFTGAAPAGYAFNYLPSEVQIVSVGGPPSVTWGASPSDGKWSTTTNWTPNTEPNVAGATATFNGAAPTAIDLDGNKTVGKVALTGGGYTLGLASTTNTLSMNNTGGTGNAEIKASGGLHTVNAEVKTVAGKNLDVIATGTGSGLTLVAGIDNTLGANLALTQSSSGSLSAGSINNAGAMTVSGTVGANAISGSGATTVNGSLTADSIVQDTLTIGAGGSVTIRATTGAAGSASAVPEPGTWVLLATALLGLLAFGRRR